MDTIAYELTRAAREFKLPVLIGFHPDRRQYVYRQTPTSIIFPIYLQPGGKLSSVSSSLPDIERRVNAAFGRSDLRLVVKTSPPPVIELIRPTPQSIELTERELSRTPPGGTVVGKHFSVSETILAGIDLANPDTPHVLVAGMTGSGKSVALKTILLGLMYSTPPDQLRIFAVDMKNRGLRFLERMPHLEGKISIEPEEVTSTVKRVAEILKLRKSSGESSPIVVLAIDEISEFAVQGLSDLLQKELLTIGRQGRELRVHLIVTVHRPDAYTLGSDFLQQFGVKIVGRLRNSRESNFVLGNSDEKAEKLPGRGAMIFAKTGFSSFRIQVLMPSPQIEELVRNRHGLYVPEVSLSHSLPDTHETAVLQSNSSVLARENEREKEELPVLTSVQEASRVVQLTTKTEEEPSDVALLRPIIEKYVVFKPGGVFEMKRGGWSRCAEALGGYSGGSMTVRTNSAIAILRKEWEDRGKTE